MEEIKVKDAIIEANEKLDNNSANQRSNTSNNDEAENRENNDNAWTKCSKCNWKSKISTHLAGHTLKHNGHF